MGVSKFSPEQRARAVRLVAEGRLGYPSEWAAIESVAQKIGVTAETLRKWVRQAQIDDGQRQGTTTDESAEVKRLKRENAELRRANEILKAAAAADRRAWGEAWKPSGLIFTNSDGSVLAPDVVSRRFRELTAKAGLPPIRFHDLRHTSASMALAAGVAMKVVSDRLGHSNTAITADLYTHVVPVVAQKAADAIAALIGRSREASRRPSVSELLANEMKNQDEKED
jgi:transposase-like protein